MKIKKAYIKNITVFNEVEIEFSQGINILIGTNGMGKTHLLKLLYMHNASENAAAIEDMFGSYENDLLRTALQESLVIVHTPQIFSHKSNIKETLSELAEITMLQEKYHGEYSYTRISVDDRKFEGVSEDSFGLRHESFLTINNCVFIPSKEILSNSKGFLALNHQRKLSFDKTYADIIANAELPESRNLSPISKKLLATISKIIGGTVTHENGSFYIKKNNRKIIFSLEAEGFRKFGLLWKLIQNGLFEEDTKLFWDEPEANINPELIPALVDILLALQKNGVQIFIATHNYNLAKYFEIKSAKENTVLYHGMSMSETGVKIDSYSSFSDIPNNPIIEADSLLLDEIYGFDAKGE